MSIPGNRQRGIGVGLTLVVCWGLVALFDLSAAQPARPVEPPKSEPAVQPAAADTSPRPSLEQFKLPANSIVVICEEAKDALRLVPRGFLISPEEYQKLLDEIARLKGQPKAERPATPTACRLTGRVEGDLVRLQAEFEFRTERRGALVGLSCGQAHASAVTLNGQVPVLHYNANEGYVLQVEEPGAHRATLDLELAAAARGAGTFRGFDLDLPRAPVTTLDLELPASAKEVRLGKTTLATKPTEDRKQSRLEAGGLGPLDRLELSWKGPVTRAVGPALLTADGRLTVQVHETFVETTAEITLSVLRGQTQQWQLQVPPQASLEVQSAAGEAVPATIEQVTPKSPLRTIRLKEPTAEPLKAVLQLQQPRGLGPVPIGPFHVLNTFRQRGTILVGAPADVRLRFVPRGEVSPREVAPDEGRSFKPVAAFSYWNLPAAEKPQTLPPPLLNLEFETVKELIYVETHQTLELTERGNWQVTTKFAITPPLRGGVTELPVELPAGYELERKRRTNEPLQEVRIDPDTREAVIVLTERQIRPFEVTLDGLLPAPAAGARQAALELPRLAKGQQTLDRGGTLIVSVPVDQELLVSPQREGVQRLAPNRLTWKVERTPARLEAAWRPYRPDLPIEGQVDIVLSGTQAVVRHRLWAPTPQGLSGTLPLRVPEAIADRLREVERGRLAPEVLEGGARAVLLNDPVTRAAPLVLHYSFALPTQNDEHGTTVDPRPFVVPLVVPEQATRGETRVRVWSDPGSLPLLASAKWEELPLEIVADRDRLPDLCLRGTRPDLPLSLRLSEPGLQPQDTVLVERALIRATVLPAGQHNYWASFRISQLRSPYLDLELPATPAGLGLKVYLDGLPVKWSPVADAAASDALRWARLKIGPELVARPAVLDVVYQLTPTQPAVRGMGYAVGQVALQTTLYPPELRGCRDHVPTRWDVRLPSGWVPLYTGSGFQFEQRWGWRGWLLAPRPAVSGAELEQWFSGGASERAALSPAEVAESDAGGTPSVVCWKTDLEPLRLHHAPQQAWLLLCSLGVLVVGLGLYFLLVRHGLYWPVVLLLGLAAALVGLLWPNLLAVIFYGCQPGLVVLLLVLAFQWLLQRRYRRQVVFLPGFTRLKGNSSLIRGGRGRTEPSTVDEPPLSAGSQRQRGSSVSRGGGSSAPGTGR